jgi:hypothetical protein
MYNIYAVVKNVTLFRWHDFCNTVFKILLSVVPGTAPDFP